MQPTLTYCLSVSFYLYMAGHLLILMSLYIYDYCVQWLVVVTVLNTTGKDVTESQVIKNIDKLWPVNH